MKRHPFALALTILFGVAAGVSAQQITKETAITLLEKFRPEVVTRAFQHRGQLELDFLNDGLRPVVMEHDESESPFFSDGPAGYKEIHFPRDPRTYVMLYWMSPNVPLYWRLVRSANNVDFELVQDGGAFFGNCGSKITYGSSMYWFSLKDLDGDGVPEVLLQDGAFGSVYSVTVMRWDGQRLTIISPLPHSRPKPGAPGYMIVGTEICSRGNNVVFEDLDGDGKAEIIAYPDLVNKPDPRATGGVSAGLEGTTRIFKLDSTGVYTLWREAPASDPFPVSVPDIAVVHPGTIPFSELKDDEHKAEKSDKDEGEGLRIFVSHPPGRYTVDDFDPAAFVFDIGRLPVTVKKRWESKKYPDLTKGNMEWQGCPVRQTPCHEDDDKGKSASSSSEKDEECKRWEVEPEDPTYPSPRAGTVFHFLGPYLELRAPKGAVYAFLKAQAEKRFASDAAATKVFIEVPISGKMKDGKLAAIGALVCVERKLPEKK